MRATTPLLPTSLAALLAAGLAACSGAPAAPRAEAPAATVKAAASARDPAPSAIGLAYPSTRRDDVNDTLHGTAVADPYRWLEDAKAPDVQAWMSAQDDLARAELRGLPERDAIAARLKQLFYFDSLSAPRHRKGRYFYSRRHADKEKAIVYWKEGEKGEERVLFDPNGWSKDGSESLGGWEVSWDGKTVAYKVHHNNSDEATLYVMDVATGKKSDIDTIEGAKYAAASWTPKGDGFYYTWLPTDPSIAASERPGYAEVRYHELGRDPKTDAVLHARTGDASRFLDASLSRDGRYLMLNIHHGWTASEAYFRDLKVGPEGAWTKVATGDDYHYYLSAHAGRFYLHTDDGAPRFRVFSVDPRRPERAAWKEIIAERPDATLDAVSIIGGKLALTYLKDAASRVAIHDLDGKLVRDVPLPGIGTVSGPSGLEDEDAAYYAFESFTTPYEIHATSIATGKDELYSRIELPVDPSKFAVEQVFYPSKDGTRISMFIVRSKDAPPGQPARTLLYGYGGFQISQTPAFTSSIYPWLERGGVYAVANLRGGGEYGERWHKDGMLDKKQNVFDDFIAAAEFLVREKVTTPDKLVIRGGSNGGLLVGAAMTQRPDLFRAVLCSVPLLDMVRYHLFGSGKTWTSEYGSAEDAGQFKTLFAYSPYHRVTKGTRYPALLMLSADSDDRVDPLHARKFAAAVQEATTGGAVLLRIEKNAGHGGADLVKAAVEKSADEYAFALDQTK